MKRIATFRKRLLAHESTIGTFLKTPSHIICDVLGLTSLDCVCIDAEHAPFDRLAIDGCVSALQANDMPSLVRVPTASPEHILNALDCGAGGIVAPHIRSPQEAESFAQASRYGAGGRGYAGSSRMAGYTTKLMAENLQKAQEHTVNIAQIEDIEALNAVDEIAAVEGIDCLFVGRIDLTVAMKAQSPADDQVVKAVEKICDAGHKAGRSVGMFVSDMKEIPKWRDAGASLFILQSDHNFILQGAAGLVDQFGQLVKA